MEKRAERQETRDKKTRGDRRQETEGRSKESGARSKE